MKSGKWPSFSDKLVPPVNAVHCDRAILILYRRSPVTYQAVSEGRIENGRLYSNGENRDEQGAIQAKAVASNWKVFSRRENLQLHARCCNPKKAPTVLALSNSIRKYRYRANLIEGLLGNLFWDGLLRWRFPSHGLRLPVFALRFDSTLQKISQSIRFTSRTALSTWIIGLNQLDLHLAFPVGPVEIRESGAPGSSSVGHSNLKNSKIFSFNFQTILRTSNATVWPNLSEKKN